ncbi:unnamed protein product [Prunus armeniaca]
MSSSMFCDGGDGKGLLRWFCDGGWCKWDGVCDGVCLQEERIFGGVWLDIRWGVAKKEGGFRWVVREWGL